MTPPDQNDLSSLSMLEIFRLEAEHQAALLTEGLLTLEREPTNPQQLEALMRAAHSLKGAARMVQLDAAVRVAHAMEDCFVVAQKKQLSMQQNHIDLLLQGVDLISSIAHTPETDISSVDAEREQQVSTFLNSLATQMSSPREAQPVAGSSTEVDIADVEANDKSLGERQRAANSTDPTPVATPVATPESGRQSVRVSAENLNRLLALSGESIVASRWLNTFTDDLVRIKRLQQGLNAALHRVQDLLTGTHLDERVRDALLEIESKEGECSKVFTERLTDLELFDRRFDIITKRLHQAVLDCRMRPFADGIQAFPRMVRDIARVLNKEAQLEIRGDSTPVDRDILERIEAPLGHLLRNAVDHGIESPAERRQVGKPRMGTVSLAARHSAGMLFIEVADDGRGIRADAIRQTLVRNNLASADVADRFSDAELMTFLFLPGFTMKSEVTEISGRGVGLDVVQSMVKDMGGSVQVSSHPGQGTQFQLQLPLTLSVVRALLVEIAAESYAFPLNRISCLLKLSREKIESVEGRQHFTLNERQIGLVTAHQVLGLERAPAAEDEVAVIVLGDTTHQYGLVVDRFLGERELTVRALDPRLGQVENISAAALLPDQSPVLIVDVDDLIRSIENLIAGELLVGVRPEADQDVKGALKRVLVVDDSLTVRELIRKLIESKGYQVETAVDGMEAWHAVRSQHYDLVVTDIDMPRLDGIELVRLIKKDASLHKLPVMIVSYKEREEDRLRGLEAGADYYLTKGSFHDETLLQAVDDLIGEIED
jgi:two-component system sensor histidine kinase and response regulator WspE